MNEIQKIRKISGLSQSEFSKKYHIPVRTLQDWEQGKRTPPAYVVAMIKHIERNDEL